MQRFCLTRRFEEVDTVVIQTICLEDAPDDVSPAALPAFVRLTRPRARVVTRTISRDGQMQQRDSMTATCPNLINFILQDHTSVEE